jgi:hypothetical protein
MILSNPNILTVETTPRDISAKNDAAYLKFEKDI